MARSRDPLCESPQTPATPAPPLAKAGPGLPVEASEHQSPEDWLARASRARSSDSRAKYARRGLAHPSGVDLDTRALLLRQLYLSQMESRAFAEALDTALLAVATGVMPDVARQDAARACLGLGDPHRAAAHLRIASRVCPASRRAFHLWTLGSSLYLAEDHESAIGALTRAARWGTRDKPLYQAQLGLARWRAGQLPTSELAPLFDALESAACGRGYGQFVLGELGHALGQASVARRYLTAFVERAGSGRVALQVALEAELRRAQRLLNELG